MWPFEELQLLAILLIFCPLTPPLMPTAGQTSYLSYEIEHLIDGLTPTFVRLAKTYWLWWSPFYSNACNQGSYISQCTKERNLIRNQEDAGLTWAPRHCTQTTVITILLAACEFIISEYQVVEQPASMSLPVWVICFNKGDPGELPVWWSWLLPVYEV